MSSPYDLVSLADLKTWLDLASTDDDALLGRLITQVSRATLGFLDRGNILPARIVETRDGRNDTEIVLRQWPVTSIVALSIDGAAIAPAPPLVAGSPHRSGYLVEAAEPAPPGHMQRLALRGRLFTAGVQNIRVPIRPAIRFWPSRLSCLRLRPMKFCRRSLMATGPAIAASSMLTARPWSPSQPILTPGNIRSPTASTHSLRWMLVQRSVSYGYVPADLCFAAMDWIAELYNYRSRSASSRNRSVARRRLRSSSKTCRISSLPPCSPIAG